MPGSGVLIGKRNFWRWRAAVTVNNFSDIEYMLKVLTNETGVRFEFEAYDIGHLYTLAYYLEMGLVQPPIFIQFVMGMGGIGADLLDNLVYMRQTAERLLGRDLHWSVLGGGRHQMNMVTAGAIMGSHVRGVGRQPLFGQGSIGRKQRPTGGQNQAHFGRTFAGNRQQRRRGNVGVEGIEKVGF
ncbi:MAG: 3-keto-5-aminohexanoate cleavage protein [Caldilineaceae bacterium]